MFFEWVHCLYQLVSCCQPIVHTGCAFPFIGRSSSVHVILSHSIKQSKQTVKYRLFSLRSSIEDRRKQAYKELDWKNQFINPGIPGLWPLAVTLENDIELKIVLYIVFGLLTNTVERCRMSTNHLRLHGIEYFGIKKLFKCHKMFYHILSCRFDNLVCYNFPWSC